MTLKRNGSDALAMVDLLLAVRHLFHTKCETFIFSELIASGEKLAQKLRLLSCADVAPDTLLRQNHKEHIASKMAILPE